MDTNEMVATRVADGQKVIEALSQHGFPWMAAFWAKKTMNEKWYFYLISPLVDSEGITETYGRLRPALNSIPYPFESDTFHVSLIGPSSELAQAALGCYRMVPKPIVHPYRWRGIMIGKMSVETAYLYPLPETLAAQAT